MDDKQIIELFFARSEQGLAEVQTKYGSTCDRIAGAILRNSEDTEECVSTSYVKLWNAIPPKRPESLCGYLCRIVRNTALTMFEAIRRRGFFEQYDELCEVIPDAGTAETRYESRMIAGYINSFLDGQSKKSRVAFTARYYFNMSINDIADGMGMSVSAVKNSLLRSRRALRNYLTERGVEL